jgi:glutamate N-acetyltransferase / amino-acid N-acetyltransferase
MNQNISIMENPSLNNVKGFFSNAVCASIKKKDKLDLGIIYSGSKAVSCGMFTRNKFQAAPVVISRKNLKNKCLRAVVVNSGNANAGTGKRGLSDAERMCADTAAILDIDLNEVAVASTGVIGQNLPMEKITAGIMELKTRIKEQNECNFSKAIMTTDTMMKVCGVTVKDGSRSYSIVGTCKGSGMIHPNMATMLAFFVTDASIGHGKLSGFFKKSVDKSLNSVTVDGDTSTNDTAIIMANGESGVTIDDKNAAIFTEALDIITLSLAKKIAFDGEGATKFIEIEVKNFKNETDAKKLAMSVAKSSLVKTAFFGEDANWGRIVCALGYSGVDFNVNKVDVSFGDLVLCKNGTNNLFSEDEASRILKKREIKVTIDMKSGNKKWTVWTSDLSHGYVEINGSYRT